MTSNDRLHNAGGARPGETEFDALSHYLEEAGRVPLLSKEQELEIARDLFEARRDLARLAGRLPEYCRRRVLGETARRLAAADPLERFDAFYQGLLDYARSRTDRRTRRWVREAQTHKRRLERSRDRLILANLRLVMHLARKYSKRGVPLADLVQEGNLGLMKAVEKFRFQRRLKFSTYAYWWIRQAVERSIGNDARTVRIPVHEGERIRRIKRIARSLEAEHGRGATPDELAEASGLPRRKVDQLLIRAKQVTPLEDPSREIDPIRWLADSRAASPAATFEERELGHQLERSLAELEPREREEVRRRFGLGHFEGGSLQDVANRMGLSRERTRQIEGSAIAKIRSGFRAGELSRFHGGAKTVVAGGSPVAGTRDRS